MAITGNITTTTGNLTKNGPGTLTLGSGSNTYTGNTAINAGTLVVTSLGNVGVASSLGSPAAGNVTISLGSTATNAMLKYVGSGSTSSRGFTISASGATATIDSSGTGALNLSGNITSAATGTSRTLQFGGTNTGLNTASGTIADNGSILLGVTKSGTGTWVLSGANTYTGPTNVNAGTLLVNGSLGNTAVFVASGATLGGSGTIAGPTTFASGAILSPGNSPGTRTFSNGLTLAAGSVFDFQLGTSSDLLSVTGGLLTGPATGTVTLNFTDSGGFAAGTYTLVNYATASGTQDFSADKFTLGTTINGFTYSFGLNGSSLELTAVSAIPEPGTSAALAGAAALGLVAFLRRRRRA